MATPVSFPTLESVDFDDILEFQTAWEITMRTHPSNTEPKAVEVISPRVVDVWKTISKRELPDKVADAIAALFATFRPDMEHARFARLRRECWAPPATGDMFPSLVAYINRFVGLTNALGVSDYAAVHILQEGLRGPAAAALGTTIQLTAELKLPAAVELVYNIAHTLDRAHQLEPRTTATSTTRPARSERSAVPESDRHRRLQIVRPEGRQGAATPQVSATEREYRRKNQFCFVCGQPGHMQAACPLTTTSKASTTGQPSPRGDSSAPQAVAAPSTPPSPEPKQEQRSPRPRRHTRLPDRYGQFAHVVGESELPEQIAQSVIQMVIADTQPPTAIATLPDTGAACCHIRSAYAKKLGLPQRTAPSKEFTVADGQHVVCNAVVDIPLRLAPGAPTTIDL